MEYSILCTNQDRFHGIILNDVLKHFDENSSHSLIVPSQSDLEFALRMNSPVSYISVRYLNDWDMDHCPHVHLTNNDSEWKPEEIFNISALNTYSCTDPHTSIYEDVVMIHKICKVSNNKDLTPKCLSQLWKITLNDVKNRIRATTQKTIRNSEGMKPHNYKTSSHQHLYKHLRNDFLSKFCSDPFVNKVLSLRGNKYVQLFVNMEVPSELLMDNVPEFVGGEWRNLCLKYDVKQSLIEPYKLE